jgi:hypothetical protein
MVTYKVNQQIINVSMLIAINILKLPIFDPQINGRYSHLVHLATTDLGVVIFQL